METMLLDRIEINPKVMTGKPVIRGTRIPVELILKKLAQKIDIKQILEDFPRLTEDDIKAAILYANSLLEDTEEIPVCLSENIQQ